MSYGFYRQVNLGYCMFRCEVQKRLDYQYISHNSLILEEELCFL